MGIRQDNLDKLLDGLNQDLSGSGFDYMWTGKNNCYSHVLQSLFTVYNQNGFREGAIAFQIVLDDEEVVLSFL